MDRQPRGPASSVRGLARRPATTSLVRDGWLELHGGPWADGGILDYAGQLCPQALTTWLQPSVMPRI